MTVSKVCKKLHLRCLTGLLLGFNTPLELRGLFTSVFVTEFSNISTIVINCNKVFNIFLKIENNFLKQYIAGQISENYYA